MMVAAMSSLFRALPLPCDQLSLAAVLKCGQSFRWAVLPLHAQDAQPDEPTHEFRLCLQDRVVCLRQSPDTLFYRSLFPEAARSNDGLTEDYQKREDETLAFIRDYFQLGTDLPALYGDWSARDPVFRGLRHRFSGIRMLRQDPWENIVSFICSSNNNIARITKMVNALCTHFSPALICAPVPTPVELIPAGARDPQETHVYHAFPPPSVLASPSVSEILRSLGFGYRAEFIQRTAEMLIEKHGNDIEAERWLAGLRTMSTGEARTELLKFVGVGRKVADCILLMSLDKREVVPVDTHVHQIAMKHYGMRSSSGGKVNMSPKLYEEVNAKLANIWGPYAGWAHSVLFTADLKSFSSYGLPTPSPSVSPEKNARKAKPALPATPSPSPRKKRPARELPQAPVAGQAESLLLDESMADRVKKRQRMSRTDGDFA